MADIHNTPKLKLPSRERMYRAIRQRDIQFEGVFVVGVRTTGVFCRPGCPARMPKLENIEFFRAASDALAAGFRPCKKCRPLEIRGATPDWLRILIRQFEVDESRRWTDADIRALGVEPTRVRRWFKQNHRMTFHGYMRSRRLAQAMGQIQIGRPTIGAALDNGFESVSGFNEAFRKWSGVAPAASRRSGSPIVVNRILTPLGPMVAAVVDDELCLLEFADRRMLETQFKRLGRIYKRPFVNAEHALIVQTQRETAEYFDSLRSAFDVPISIRGSAFQQSVWTELRKIPCGQTASYAEMARAVGRRGAQRAVGRANGDNRIAIIVPCHRVIRSDGELSGYGGQVWRKRWLLDHEQQLPVVDRQKMTQTST